MQSYGDADSMLKERAKISADRARNEALSLKCPHCSAVYFDFEGCMALVCGTCKGNFCAYCHSDVKTSKGAHDHVRYIKKLSYIIIIVAE